jgi:hypothetical protein
VKAAKKMKNIKTRKIKEEKRMQCVLCQANFEVWLDNLKPNPEREEILRKHFLGYCPICTKKDESK